MAKKNITAKKSPNKAWFAQLATDNEGMRQRCVHAYRTHGTDTAVISVIARSFQPFTPSNARDAEVAVMSYGCGRRHESSAGLDLSKMLAPCLSLAPCRDRHPRPTSVEPLHALSRGSLSSKRCDRRDIRSRTLVRARQAGCVACTMDCKKTKHVERDDTWLDVA